MSWYIQTEGSKYTNFSFFFLYFLSRRSVTPRDLSNTGSPAGFPKTRAKKRRGMWRIKSAMLSLCLCECGPHSPIATFFHSDSYLVQQFFMTQLVYKRNLKKTVTVSLSATILNHSHVTDDSRMNNVLQLTGVIIMASSAKKKKHDSKHLKTIRM